MTTPKPTDTHTRAVAMLDALKLQFKGSIEGWAKEASALTEHSENYHLPIIEVMQLALAQTACEYLLQQGESMQMAVDGTIEATGKAMNDWLDALHKHKNKQ